MPFQRVGLAGGRNRCLPAVEAAYGMPAAFWSPDGKWIAADDGRILVIVPTDPPVIRVLTDESAEGRFEGELSRFAVTGLDLLAPPG